jgi:ligand-binding sensor domain-containing protein/serine phosphatase RsbU (regulator of sigma subunit)
MNVFLKYILFFSFVCTKLQAQVARFRHLTSDEGLTQNAVTCVLQDKKGFMWVGTYDGLNRYDGNKILTWKGSLDDSAGISSNSIRCLYEDDNNALWVGTYQGGLCKLDLTTGKIKSYYVDSTKKISQISNDNVYTIGEYEPGKLYLATGDGLNIFDRKTATFTVIRKRGPNAIPFLTNSIRAMTRDKNGHLWFGHSAGITEYDPSTKKCNYFTDTSANKIRGNSIRALFADSRGYIWVSMWAYGCCLIDTKTGKVYSFGDTTSIYKSLYKVSLVSQFYEDKKGNVWIATAEHGLACYNPKTRETFLYEKNPDDAETISDNTVFCVTEDRSGLIWSGTWKGGLNIFDPKTLKFGLQRHESNNPFSLHNNNTFAFCKKSAEELYVGTSAGVSVYTPSKRTFVPLRIDERDNNSLKHNSVIYYLFKDADETLWISTSGGGLYHYLPEKSKYRNYVPTADTNSLSWHSPSTILRDLNGQLWIATGYGLNLYHPAKDNFSRILNVPGNQNTPASNNISALVLRNDGLIWVGTGDAGLDLFDPQTREVLRHYNTNEKGKTIFPDVGITGVFYDRKGTLWVGTTGGLCSLDEKTGKVTSYVKIHPCFSTLIFGIEEDHSGNIWFSTAMGLVRFNPATKEYKVFDTSDGLQGKEFSGRAVYKSDGGKLFFGGLNGFNAFLPEEIRSNTTPPGVAVTALNILNQDQQAGANVAYLDTLTLSWQQYFFTVDFAALDYTYSSKNRFKYFLEGFNEKWVDNGSSHTVTFTNLDPGEYLLLVKAINNDGVESVAPARLKIIITPPFWKTTWFYMLCTVAAALGIYVFIKYRERKLTKEKEKLEHKVKVRTEELEVEKQKVEVAHKDIKDSILYAKKIQSAILPGEDEFAKHFSEFFILFQPKDIVSGDFFWITERNGYVFYATADCTGHGVPGGFMTMLGHGLLNEIVNEKNIYDPAAILNMLREKIILSLKQTGRSGENKDGMDIVLCRVEKEKRKLCYAAANNSFHLLRNGTLMELKADKQPVGIYGDDLKPFTSHEISLEAGDMVYTFTDGYADQFGGPKGKKFKYKQLEQTLVRIGNKLLAEQKTELYDVFAGWKGELEQIDDVLVIGLRVQ